MTSSDESPGPARWSPARARAWFDERPWQCGANYLPSTAVNWTEMWQAATFDPDTIRRELGWAAELGLTSARVGLPFVVWEHDRDGLLERFGTVLEVLDGLGMNGMPFLLDDCEFSGVPATTGPQPDPEPGLHNSRATGSPGRAMVMDRSTWPRVEAYVADVVSSFADDPRVLVWDVYNEPGNRVLFRSHGAEEADAELEAAAGGLLERAVAAVRAVDPVQPLTVAAWRVPPPDADPADQPYTHPLDRAAFAVSDLTSFHAYCPPETMLEVLAIAEGHGRPVLCTEWMGRHAGSRVENLLPLLRERDVWCWVWGFVRGRSQTHLPWPAFLEPGHADTGEWFHDLVDDDGTPHRPLEVEVIRRETARAR